MRTRKFVFGVGALLIGLTLGCSVNQEADPGYTFGMTEGSLFEAAGENWAVSPVFGVYRLTYPLELFEDFSDSVRLEAYQDSACTTKTSGSLAIPVNPLPLSGGQATFNTISYTVDPPVESVLYLKATLMGDDLSYCSLPMTLFQRFNREKGFVLGGFPDAAGAPPAADRVDTAFVHRVDPTGRLVVAGKSANTGGGSEMALWRYYPNGSFDSTFGTGGRQSSGTTGIAGATGANEQDQALDVRLDLKKRITAVGTSQNASGGTEIALWRVFADGSADSSFGTSGKVHFSAGVLGLGDSSAVHDLPRALQIDSSNRLIVAGSTQNASGGTELFVVRFLENGSLDLSFGTSGIFLYGSTGAAGATSSQELDEVYSLAAESGGGWRVVGSSRDNAGLIHLALWGIGSEGTLETSFGNQGVSVVSAGAGGLDRGKAIQATPDKKWIVAGSSKNAVGGTQLAAWRFLANGTLDETFAGGGFVYIAQSAMGAAVTQMFDQGSSVLVDSSLNRYVIAGSSRNSSGGTQMTVWVFSDTGVLDPLFNTIGILSTAALSDDLTDATVNEAAVSVQMDKSGTYSLSGFSFNSSGGQELALWRLFKTGALVR